MSSITHTREVASTTLQYANFLIFTPETHTNTHRVLHTRTGTSKHLKSCQRHFTPTTSNQTPWVTPYCMPYFRLHTQEKHTSIQALKL